MIRRLKYIVLLLSVALVLGNCKKDAIGPDVENYGNNPEVTSELFRSKDTLKIPLNESIYFIAAFKNVSPWEITIIGKESGATATLKGVGVGVNQISSNWTGISDNPPSKFSNEEATATLSFPNAPNEPTLSVTFYIKASGDLINSKSVLLSDFSGTSFYGFPGPGVPLSVVRKKWASEYPLPRITDTRYSPSPAGDNYLFIEDVTSGVGNPFALYTQANAANRDNGFSADLTFPLYSDPSQVYFNFYIYNSDTSNAWVKIIFKEIDNSERVFDYKQTPSKNVGWKLVSVKYSDLVLGNNASGIGNPARLASVGVALLSNNPNLSVIQSVSVALDHMIFTFGGPYKP